MKTLEERRTRALWLRRVRRIGAWILIVAAAAAICVGLPWLVWKGPYVLDAQYIDKAKVKDGGAALVTGLRTAIVACVAALGAIIALLYTARTYRLTRRGQVTDRFTKALERLGSEQIYVRIGGILALEQIVQDAPEQATDAAHVLGHFLRAQAPAALPASDPDEESATPLPDRPVADIQVALTALTRPESRTHVDPREVLDLSELHLAGADLLGADLTGCNLNNATLTDADLRLATLTVANLCGTTLTGAVLNGATLTGAKLRGAMLSGAKLRGATLISAVLYEATLTDADLYGATLTDADLYEATLAGANLGGAMLVGTRYLTQEQVDQVGVDENTRLPLDVTAPSRLAT
ncbi:pentapeptide repeat-containing protein [Streptomyces sp. ISL-1]|uniref:pentapeptide repeat-containing protein n=1 Tax=Streptomyces sp. ISL-1 TaxID=2817657 RepID=UPI001BEB227B|nr:pentapeptide repeat-containing protein [Streptomyces sp. ISL-1]MBT2391455.1 pentapeptide repeat-containing protein [Streptomyces sp. ISL-1]